MRKSPPPELDFGGRQALLLGGNGVDVLRRLPGESVQCVVTSPPYWGLRVYGTEGQVWGGDPQCVHEWGADEPPRRARWGDPETLQEKQKSNRGSKAMVAALEASQGRFCTQTGCGAWRGELGQEPSVWLYVQHLVLIFRELRRVLRKDGVCWLNLGDSYVSEGVLRGELGRDRVRARREDGLPKPKDLALVPQRAAIALQEDGWYVRADVIWWKPNGMPHPAKDRPGLTHEHVLLLTRSERYFYDADAVRQPVQADSLRASKHSPRAQQKHFKAGCWNGMAGDPSFERPIHTTESGANLRSVWSIPTHGYAGAHFATFPEDLAERCIRLGTSEAGCCARCGKPWVRVIEKGAADRAHQRACGGNNNGSYEGQGRKDYDGAGVQNPSDVKRSILASLHARRTIGWKPACKCAAGEPVPCVVLDPFLGSGTTAAVAIREGRRAVGIELNPEYLVLAEARCAGAESQGRLIPLAAVGVDGEPQSQAALFGGEE